MNKLLTTLFALVVASATGFAHAQASAPAAAPAAKPPAEAPAKAAAPASPASLQAKIAMCLGCHNIVGYQASFPEVHKVPKIAGQSAGYIDAALTAYKGGDRKHPTMRGIADALSDQDIKDIAAYYSKLGQDEAPAARRQAEPRAERASRRAAAEGRLRVLPRRQLLQADRPQLSRRSAASTATTCSSR